MVLDEKNVRRCLMSMDDGEEYMMQGLRVGMW